jgi:hypothetical protein
MGSTADELGSDSLEGQEAFFFCTASVRLWGCPSLLSSVHRGVTRPGLHGVINKYRDSYTLWHIHDTHHNLLITTVHPNFYLTVVFSCHPLPFLFIFNYTYAGFVSALHTSIVLSKYLFELTAFDSLNGTRCLKIVVCLSQLPSGGIDKFREPCRIPVAVCTHLYLLWSFCDPFIDNKQISPNR